MPPPAETALRRPVSVYASKELFEPLGMSISSYLWQDRYEKLAAAGHDPRGRLKTKRFLFRRANAGYSLYCTPYEYARFLVEILKTDRSAATLRAVSRRDRTAGLVSRIGVSGDKGPAGRREGLYPSPGCVPAEPGSVSPDPTSGPESVLHQHPPSDTRVMPEKIPGVWGLALTLDETAREVSPHHTNSDTQLSQTG
jgi:CubicO group peptidase (beta-lactamase class C family)